MSGRGRGWQADPVASHERQISSAQTQHDREVHKPSVHEWVRVCQARLRLSVRLVLGGVRVRVRLRVRVRVALSARLGVRLRVV